MRAPLALHEQQVIRTYLEVEDIAIAVGEAEAAGAVIAYPPTRQRDTRTWAIYFLGDGRSGCGSGRRSHGRAALEPVPAADPDAMRGVRQNSRRPRLVLGVAGLVFNIGTVPTPPINVGLPDVGPFVAIWYVILFTQLIRVHRKGGSPVAVDA